MDRLAVRSLCCLAALLVVQVGVGYAQGLRPPPNDVAIGVGGWRAEFPQPLIPVGRASVGVYKDGPTVVNFESLSPLLLEPTPTGVWDVLTTARRRGHVVFHDYKPGLIPNPDPRAQPFYKRAEGAISALVWVDQEFADVRVSVQVNTTGGPRGRGSYSRQGPMARWDKGSNWLWCAVNFAAGTVSIVRSQHFGIMKDIQGSERAIQDFTHTSAYDVVLDAVGESLQCQVLKGQKLVADTGTVMDTVPVIRGVAGALFEVAPQKSFEPLEGSFNGLTAVDLRRP